MIKGLWESISAKHKRYVIFAILALVFLTVVGIKQVTQPRREEAVEKPKIRGLALDEESLNDSVFTSVNQILEREREDRERELAELKQNQASVDEKLDALLERLDKGKRANRTGKPTSKAKIAKSPPSAPTQTAVTNSTGRSASAPKEKRFQLNFPKPPGYKRRESKPEPRVALLEDGIGEALPDPEKVNQERKKDHKEKGYYLAPSMMKATLITGLNAKVSLDGQNNPKPIFLRVAAPAILPNNVKKNLKGCFIVAEGVGDLATERVEVRTKLIACYNQDKIGVIEEPINGYVTDADGKAGIYGKAVSNMGKTLGLQVGAGILGGAGKLFSEAAKKRTTNPTTGAVTTEISSGELTKAAVGQGLGNATESLSKLYLNLANMQMPYIDVRPGKHVEIFITKGTLLKVKEI